jgi:3-hydroxyisobutyrate dehydrogenase
LAGSGVTILSVTADRAQLQVGFVGLGAMGRPMCRRLAGAGFRVVASDIRAEMFSFVRGLGAEWALSAGAAADRADVLITMLPGPREVSDVIAEVTDRLAPGSTWIDMSSAAPGVAAAITAALSPRGARQLDAPVGGGPGAASDGKLLAFVGGSPKDVETQRPLLDVLADRVVHVGPAGTGYTVKLLIQLLWFGQAVASAEVLTLAHRAGIDPDVLREAVGHSAAATRFMDADAPALLSGDDPTSFSFSRINDQLATVLRFGEELAVPLDVAAVVHDIHRKALAYYGSSDSELLAARFISERAGVQLRPSDG